MAQILVRGLDDSVKLRLRAQAARQGRSMEDFVREVLRMAADEYRQEAGTPGSRFSGFGESSPRFGEGAETVDELLALAAAGETVPVTRGGRVVALLVPAEKRLRPVDRARLRAVTAGMARQQEPAGAFARRMRDQERY